MSWTRGRPIRSKEDPKYDARRECFSWFLAICAMYPYDEPKYNCADSKRQIKADNNAKVYAIMYVYRSLMKITTQDKR